METPKKENRIECYFLLMTCFLSHDDSLTCLRLASKEARYRSAIFNGIKADFSQSTLEEDAVVLSRFGEELSRRPLSVVVSNARLRSEAKKFACHVMNEVTLWDSFWPVDAESSLFASDPELTFLQLAAVLPVAALAAIGCELCGTYSMDPGSKKGFVKRDPLTSTVQLRTFLKKHCGRRDVAKAKEALSYVVDNSASPMETYLALRLSLPRRLGGFGLPKPVMNHVLKTGLSGDDPAHYVLDLYWPSARLAIEYDSDAFHASFESIAYDARRRSVLMGLGVTVITVTRDQVMDEKKLLEIVRAAMRALGGCYRCRSAKHIAERKALAKTINAAFKYPAGMPKGKFEIDETSVHTAKEKTQGESDAH